MQVQDTDGVVEIAANFRADIRRRVADELRSFFEEQRSSLESEIQPLLDEVEATVDAGGKRLRPIFCYWGHLGAGGDGDRPIVRVGAALELLHTFALIHDDVMDRSPTRRGRYASFRALGELARLQPHRGDPHRFGESAAILAGDLALVLADRLLATSGFSTSALARVAPRYDRMRIRAIAGQYLDLLAAHRGEVDEVGAQRIGELKSGGYTVADPLQIGAALAAPEGDAHRILAAFGHPLGVAFQIRDDVLGVFGDPEVTGKDRDSDLREGKQTVLLAKARNLASEREAAFLRDHVGIPDLDPADADRIREILLACGALDATLDLIATLNAEAKAALDPTVVGDDVAHALAGLADLVSVRND